MKRVNWVWAVAFFSLAVLGLNAPGNAAEIIYQDDIVQNVVTKDVLVRTPDNVIVLVDASSSMDFSLRKYKKTNYTLEQEALAAGEDLAYTPKTLKALASVRSGAIGRVLWTRSREAHPGPHSDWFWNKEISGGGAIIDLGCHCIEIGRNFVGKDVRPVEVMCWGATQVHPIEAEDHAIGLVRYASGAVAQFEVAWSFRGGLDLRDEVSGTEGAIWLNHWLRTGFEMYTSGNRGGYVTEKAEAESGMALPSR